MVTSKYDRSHGAPRTPGRINKPGDTAHVKGTQPKMGLRDTVAPSAPSHSNTSRLPPGGHVETVGHAPNGSGKWLQPTHAHGHHGSDGIHDPRVSTDGAQGQAWHASGGQFGQRSPRPGSGAPAGTNTIRPAADTDSIRSETGTDSP